MDSGKVLDHPQQISDRDSICEAHTTSHWFTRADGAACPHSAGDGLSDHSFGHEGMEEASMPSAV
jgi:hypothetical protein